MKRNDHIETIRNLVNINLETLKNVLCIRDKYKNNK